jgi:hypothetical protein
VKETPNKDDPEADIDFILEELLTAFADPDGDQMSLRSTVGSRFHARVVNAAQFRNIQVGA